MAPDVLHIEPGGVLRGRLRPPGDKSISHRALLIGAIAEGPTTVEGWLDAADCRATLTAVRALGVRVDRRGATDLVVHGVGLHGLRPPPAIIDCGNSGTTLRLLTGLLAGQPFRSELTGDESLRRRPMAQVATGLAAMGAQVDMTEAHTAPVVVHGQRPLRASVGTVTSAQQKSALLLAALYAEGDSDLHEPVVTRDHTERMLRAFGWPVAPRDAGGRIRIGGAGAGVLAGQTLRLPGDLSSAAFFIVGAALAAGSELLVEEVGLNPTRSGVLEVLKAMGAEVEVMACDGSGSEPRGSLRVRGGRNGLRATAIAAECVPRTIDELPVLMVAAACADGATTLTGVGALRAKESDRIETMAAGLRVLGIEVATAADAVVVHGGRLRGGTVDAQGDHRVAMAFAIAALRAETAITIRGCAAIATSFPAFTATAASLGLRIAAEAAA